MPPRVLLGFLLAIAIAGAAHRARVLSISGAVAAIVIGTAAVAAGWSWAFLLIAFFVSSSALSRVGARRKAARTEAIVAKGGPRDAMQVMANGAPFALAAIGYVVTTSPIFLVVGVAALAAATADTWATEIGTLVGGVPRSIITREPLEPGMSGGVTAIGTLASIVGAVAIALMALALGWSRTDALAAVAGGLSGSLVDSLLGATVQARRWCDVCETMTERETHSCGRQTRHVGGARWMDNDWVNVISGLTGALTALAVAAALGSV
jgi:uncharacterized protein (TIGR00297 family)